MNTKTIGLKIGDKVSFRVNNHIHCGTVSAFTKHKVRVKYTHAGFGHDKLMFERNLTLV